MCKVISILVIIILMRLSTYIIITVDRILPSDNCLKYINVIRTAVPSVITASNYFIFQQIQEQFSRSSDAIIDSTPVTHLCQCVEDILQHGLKERYCSCIMRYSTNQNMSSISVSKLRSL